MTILCDHYLSSETLAEATSAQFESAPSANLAHHILGLEFDPRERIHPEGSSMTDIARLFQAFLAPAIFVSATALLILSINVRLWVSSADCGSTYTLSMTPPRMTECKK